MGSHLDPFSENLSYYYYERNEVIRIKRLTLERLDS